VEGRFGASQLMSWARRLKRVFELDLEHCPNCGGELKIIAANPGAIPPRLPIPAVLSATPLTAVELAGNNIGVKAPA
jgi:hypothetical protein